MKSLTTKTSTKINSPNRSQVIFPLIRLIINCFLVLFCFLCCFFLKGILHMDIILCDWRTSYEFCNQLFFLFFISYDQRTLFNNLIFTVSLFNVVCGLICWLFGINLKSIILKLCYWIGTFHITCHQNLFLMIFWQIFHHHFPFNIKFTIANQNLL